MLLPAMKAAIASTVPAGKFILYPEGDRNRIGLTVQSIKQDGSTDVILFPVKDSDPAGFWRFWPISQVSDDSVLVLDGIIVRVNPIQTAHNYSRTQIPKLGSIYLIEDAIALCAATPDTQSRSKGRLYDVATGAYMANYSGGIVGFPSWELLLPAADQALVQLYNPAAP
jgi:hypothetical protein